MENSFRKNQVRGLQRHTTCKPQPRFANLQKLGYGYHNNIYPVRIIRLWHSFSFSSYHESSTNFILLDAEDNQFWAIADTTYGKPWEPLICRGLLYYISNFKIVPARGPFNPIDTDKTIIFGKRTTIEDCLYGSTVTQFSFGLCSWPQIQSRLNNKKILTDVAGIIMDAGDVEYDRNNITRINITLLHSSLMEIHVCLWGRLATLFRMELRMSRRKNVVLIVTGLLVKIVKGKLSLTSTPATDLFFDPNCKQTKHLPQHITNTYGDFICRIPNRPNYTYQLLPEPDTTPPYITIQELLQPQIEISKKFHCDVIILDIGLRTTQQQGSCIRCKQSVTPAGTRYYCRGCDRDFITTPVNRPPFQLLVVDRTANTHFNLQDRTLQQLTGKSRDILLSTAKQVNGIHTFPQALHAIKGARCTLEVTIKTTTHSTKSPVIMIEDIIKYLKLHQSTNNV